MMMISQHEDLRDDLGTSTSMNPTQNVRFVPVSSAVPMPLVSSQVAQAKRKLHVSTSFTGDVSFSTTASTSSTVTMSSFSGSPSVSPYRSSVLFEALNEGSVQEYTSYHRISLDSPASISAGSPMSTYESAASSNTAAYSTANSSTCSHHPHITCVPSPSRSRLDARYAQRFTSNQPTQGLLPTQTSMANTTALRQNTHLMSPPSDPAADWLHPTMPPPRDNAWNAGIFRPKPVITHSPASSLPFRTLSSPTSFASSVNTPTRTDHERFFPRAMSSSPLWERSLSRYGTSSSRRVTNISQLNNQLGRNNSSTSVSSDRFIPSRVTSNLTNLDLWDDLARRSQDQHRIGSTSSTNIPSMSAAPWESEANRPVPPNTGFFDITNPDFIGQRDRSNSNDAIINIHEPAMLPSTGSGTTDDSSIHGANTSVPASAASSSNQNLLNVLLRSELLNENDSPLSSSYSTSPGYTWDGSSSTSASSRGNGSSNRLRYLSAREMYQDQLYHDQFGTTGVGTHAALNSLSLIPVRSAASQRLMAAPPKRKRRISKVPFKVLDAPALQDDFYLNLVDWSSLNVLAVGLGSCVYLWSACTSKVTKLCDLAVAEDLVTSVAWSQRGTHLSVGTNRGEVQLWDTVKCRKIRTLTGHSARVGTLAWTGPILASGSRDRLVYLRDVRVPSAFTNKLFVHKQEVCGLKWSYDEPAFLASGGNDNHLYVIDSRNPTSPVHDFAEHQAAVKAITWSPHQHGLLASGGGTADRCIRFWNTLSGLSLSKVDTGSQVCNLAWSQNCNEIVSTHGYSLNQIAVWRYPGMTKVNMKLARRQLFQLIAAKFLWELCPPAQLSVCAFSYDATINTGCNFDGTYLPCLVSCCVP
jgi:cell division cycle 20-like protein 1, cofactor of APC complex